MTGLTKPVRIGVIVLFAALCATRSLIAIRPVIIMFYGGGLERPVFVTDTMVFHDLENPTTIRARDLGDRKYLEVAMFWGPRFNPYRSGEKPMSELTVAHASQHGRLYPATGREPAVLLQTIPWADAQPKPTDLERLNWGGLLPAGDVDKLVGFGVPARMSK